MVYAPSISTETFMDRIGFCAGFIPNRDHSFQVQRSVLPAISELGIRHLRMDSVLWDKAGSAWKDMHIAAEMGVKFSLITYQGGPFGTRTSNVNLRAIMERHGPGAIAMIEGTNEPTYSEVGDSTVTNSPAYGTAHQREIWNELKNYEREIIMASPSLITTNNGVANSESALANYFEWLNLHSYAGYEHPETSGPGSLNNVSSAIRTKFPGKPTVITEIGYHTETPTSSGFKGVTEAVKARYYPRMFMNAVKWGARRVYAYRLEDIFPADDASNVEDKFGLIDYDGVPKASYRSLKAFLNLINAGSPLRARRNDYTPFSSGPIGFRNLTTLGINTPRLWNVTADDYTDLHMLAFERQDGTGALAVWLGKSGVDMNGNETAISSRSISISMLLPPQSIRQSEIQDDGSVVRRVIRRPETDTSSGSTTSFPFSGITITDRVSIFEDWVE